LRTSQTPITGVVFVSENHKTASDAAKPQSNSFKRTVKNLSHPSQNATPEKVSDVPLSHEKTTFSHAARNVN